MTSDRGVRIHRRQYVVGPEVAWLRPDWTHTPLDGGLWLSYCPDLRVRLVHDLDGRAWRLLGLASQTVRGRPDPAEELARLTGPPAEALVHLYESWVGRWTVIGGGEIHLDATGQLPCHWAEDDHGRTWASSSPAGLRSMLPARPERRPELIYERGLSWVAPPLGSFDGAKRLLPSQILNVGSGTTRWRRLVVPSKDLGLAASSANGADPAMAGFIEAVGHGMKRLPSEEPKQLALTAGADSRFVLAAALAAQVNVELFTRRSARMSLADRSIPPRLAAAVGLQHREVRPKRADQRRLLLAAGHTDGHVSAGDALPFIEGVRDGFVGIEIGGQGFGAGKVKNRRFPAVIGDASVTAALVADHFGESADSSNRVALAHWLSAVAEHEAAQQPDDRIDWRDRFYLEQRTSGWQAAKEQLYDLHGHQRFFPINSARVFGLLLAIDPEIRSDGSHRRALIAMADERLLCEPFNPPGERFGLGRRATHLLTVDRRGASGRILRRAVGRR